MCLTFNEGLYVYVPYGILEDLTYDICKKIPLGSSIIKK